LHEGQALLVLNRNQDAREAFDRVVQIDANLVAGHLGRGIAMLRLHNIVGALLSADKARQLDPTSAQAY
jgi:Flp pilus assembly protein TadD